MTRQRLIIILLSVIAGLGLAAILALSDPKPAEQRQRGGLHAVTNDAFGGDFTLTDHTGKRVTQKDYRSQYQLIYFGFTYCPAICPTELAKISATLNDLGKRGEQILPLFITVDPERDTVEAMANYVPMFHPRLVGLTGSVDEIAQTLKDYKIYAAKAQDPAMTEYTMDHSSFIYFIAPDGRLLHIFKMDDSAADISNTISQWLAQENAAVNTQ